MNIPTPTNKTCLVEPIYDTVSAGGIVLCKQAQERQLPNKGIVRAIAPNCDADFVVGDTVIHNRHTQEWEVIPWGDKKLSRVKISDVEGICE